MHNSDSDSPTPPPPSPRRQHPNILLTGTPGTGKTTTASLLSLTLSYPHIEVGALVKQHALHTGYSAEFDSYYIDEDKVVDYLEDEVSEGGRVVDHHGCDFFPERWFDLVVVLRAGTEVLFGRLEKRNYPPKKITENIECEIMQVVLEEARDSYAGDIVWERSSETVDDMERNVEEIAAWVEAWVARRAVE
ncbi:P-loop containing nucleoside triphosphate hydrolase protein [Fimicolochytrium jonesii]|uniref:P-loop containing nucleoside triphosphate hydrolase protein n=1 Tax=Fimicolochytrium jonesii TaxID=1396493 RepID=UPI0022FEF993|nr:P-loop containing nucleoside triphosphate hydrolase protein [Fimicolochytrium jonesii]KAI8815664.1 P-loop containing nucleoside triphosphate hydrolase protein [Fimicolochytrium jonesii]